MQTHEIPTEQWITFLQQFTQEHRGQHVHVESQAMEAMHALAFDLPLVDIRAKGNLGVLPHIEVIAGDRPEDQIFHDIAHPKHVRIAQDESGRPALKIASADSSVTVIRFGPASPADPAGFGSS